MSGGAVIVRRQNQYLRTFRDVGAVSPATARTLEELDIPRSWVFRRMAARGVFVRVDEGRWFMDEAAAEQRFLEARRTRILIFFVAAFVFLALVLVLRMVKR